MLINNKQYDNFELQIISVALKNLSKDFEPGTLTKNLLESMALDFEVEAKNYNTPPKSFPDLEND